MNSSSGIFQRNGGSGGEFFYAPGFHEEFSPEAFAVVGDDSKGIGVTAEGITATTYKADVQDQTLDVINSLDRAEELVDLRRHRRWPKDFRSAKPLSSRMFTLPEGKVAIRTTTPCPALSHRNRAMLIGLPRLLKAGLVSPRSKT